jgi:redox-sensitive bicupin YhaK (pirin superfamily)
MTAPRYQDIEATAVTLLTNESGDAIIRVIAGILGDADGPGVTHTPITLLHVTLMPGGRLQLPWRKDYNALTYVLAGQGRVGDEGHPLAMGQIASAP